MTGETAPPSAPQAGAMPAYLGMPAFPDAAREAVADSQLRRNLTHATTAIRTKRAKAVGELSDWEELRQAAKAIKDHTLANLDTYLLRLEENVTKAGGHVHWARDADEANAIVTRLVQQADADTVVKVKSMATQETGLNDALAAAGIAAVETDLAERMNPYTTIWTGVTQGDGPRDFHLVLLDNGCAPARWKSRSIIQNGPCFNSRAGCFARRGGWAWRGDRLRRRDRGDRHR